MSRAVVVLAGLMLSAASIAQAANPVLSRIFTFSCNADFTSCPDGFDPTRPPLQLGDGNFYGVTWWAGQGNANAGGTVFRVTPTGQAFILHTFLPDANGRFPNGENPVLAFTKGPDGYLYGVTESGGAHGFGVMYKISPLGGGFQVIYNFCSQTSCIDGPGPLTLGTDGNFYGVENTTIYRITRTGVWTLLHHMNQTTEGTGNTLMLASDGNFYGTGRMSNGGIIFRLTPTGQFTLLHHFANYGLFVTSNLIQASDGYLYGATSESGSGTGIFRMSLAGGFQFIHEMSDAEGFEPVQLLQASDGNLWGISDFRNGSLFAISTSGVSLYAVPFNCAADGCTPQGIVQSSRDHKFYGTAINGGTAAGQNPLGTVFKVDAGLP